jgi:hypothetical protein
MNRSLVAKTVKLFIKIRGMAILGQKDQSYNSTHLASVSKVITATAILKLIDANKIKLDQKESRSILNFPISEVTNKTHFHRSGMRNYVFY